MPNMKREIWQYLLVFLLMSSLFMISCSKTTGPNTFGITGVVTDENGLPISGATVIVYHSPQLSESLQGFKAQYPNHGVSIDYYKNFDHRKTPSILSVVSGSDGSYKINGLSEATYNLVAIKENYGFEYVQNYDLVDNVENFQICVKPLIEIPQTISGGYSLESGRNYYITSGLVVLPEGCLNIGTDVRLFIEPGYDVNIHGKLNIYDASSLYIGSSDGLFDGSCDQDLDKYNSITLHNQYNGSIQNIVIDDTMLGLRVIDSNDFAMNNTYVNAHYQGIVVVGSQNITLSQCSVNGSRETIRAALTIENSSAISMDKCHLWENYNGIQVAGTDDVAISNCYFINNSSRDVFIAEDGSATISRCTFKSSNTAIYGLSGQADIVYNDIQARVGINIERVGAWFSANFNNIDCTDIGIKSRCMFYNSPILHLDCTRNYWYTNDQEAIAELIYDRDNVSPDEENYHLLVTIIDFLPIASFPNDVGVFN